MIVSHKYKYLFIQFPHTGCTAIGRELFEFYDGETMLIKHAAYHDFLRVATEEMKDYFVFSTVRNPMDELVTFYYKVKSNHDGDFTRPERLKKNGGWVTPRIMKRYEYVMKHDPSFIEYLIKFYPLPHANWTILDHKNFNYLMHYENLQEDFSTVLKMLNLDQVRPIPLVNPTKKDHDNLISTLNEEELDKLNWIIGPLLEFWDYPPVKGDSHDISTYHRAVFKVMCMIRSVYWRYIRKLT